MPEFTKGKWWIAPPIFDGDAIFAPTQDKNRRGEVVAMGILNHADAQLIAAAPDMYNFIATLYDMLSNPDDTEGLSWRFIREAAKQVLELADGSKGGEV